MKTSKQGGALAPSIVAGIVVGASGILNATALAALVFKGDLSPHLVAGAGVTLFTVLCMGTIVALLSSYRGTVAIAQDTTIAIVALAAAAASHAMAGAPSAERLVTVLVTLGTTTLLVGTIFVLLGTFKLGGLVRFLPFPVVGGFLAGSGWLLADGAINVVTGESIAFSHLAHLVSPPMLLRWVPALLFAIGMHVLLRKVKHFLAVPAYMIGSLALFFALVAVSGRSLASLRSMGMLLGPFPDGGLFHPILPADLARVRWSVVFAQIPTMLVIALVSVIGLLLNITGLELATKQEIDANRELRVAGLANLAAGLGGGIPGYHGLSASILGRRMGGGMRVTGLLAGAMGGIGLMVSTRVLSYVPTFILGGLLLYLSLDFLLEWVVASAKKLPRLDYAIVILILLAIGVIGFLPGVGLGIAMSLGIFVLNYARLDVVRNAFPGSEFRSKVDRSAAEAQLLKEEGVEVFVMELVGFLFFGTASQIVTRVRARLADEKAKKPLKLLVLDFRHVVGLDSSAMSSFMKVRDLAEGSGFDLALTNVSADLLEQFTRNELVGENAKAQVYPTIDRAMEAWENTTLQAARDSLGPTGVRASLSRLLPQEIVERVMEQLVETSYDRDALVFQKGDRSQDLYFIESGQLRARLVLPSGKEIRLRAMTSGSLVGEIAFCLDLTRTADVVAELPSVVYRLSADRLRDLEINDRPVAIAVHKLMSRVLAERLADVTNALEAALR
jgi:SulP family sulfate permease